mgnify:CR=1 FL=1
MTGISNNTLLRAKGSVKIVIAENVKGLVASNAKRYVNEIIKAFKSAGYSV